MTALESGPLDKKMKEKNLFGASPLSMLKYVQKSYFTVLFHVFEFCLFPRRRVEVDEVISTVKVSLAYREFYST